MTARKRTRIVTETTKHSGRVIGPVRIVHPAIQAVGCDWMYDHLRHAFLVSIKNLPDVEACLIASGYNVEARGGALL